MTEENKDAPAESAEPSIEIGSMKTGDYMIHVYIQKGKNFKSVDFNESEPTTVDPILMVECCGETKYGSSKSDVPEASSNPQVWRDHIFFEPRGMHASAIETETISIKVMNKGFIRDEMIGRYDFDITSVYFKEKHCMQHQWVALFNPEGDNFADISGYLLISISVQGPGDEQVQLEDQAGPEADNQVMMPAQIKKEFKQLTLRFIHAYNLPKMDTWGTIDAFIKTVFQGKKMKTVTKTAKGNITLIEQEFLLPIQWPLASDRLMLQLYDEDIQLHEIVGSMFFSLKKLCNQGDIDPEDASKDGIFFWQNLYGAPVDYTGSVAKLMNDNPEMASAWKGKILMNITSQKSDHPERKIRDIDDSVIKTAQQLGLFTDKEYDFIAEIGMGICLPTRSKKYKIMIKIGEFELVSSDPKEYKNGYNRWSERFNQQTIKTMYQNIDEMENVFLYLMEGKHPICYWKGKVRDFTNPNPEYQWIALKVDKAIGSVENDYEAGMIQIKMSIHSRNEHGGNTINYKEHQAWKKPPPRRLGSKKIRCFVFQCRNIPSADADGSSDSYISVWNPEATGEYEKNYKTQVIEDSLNPIYLETIEMLYDMADLDTAPPIVLNIWDQDEGVMDSDDYLGRAVIKLKDASSNLSEHGVEDDIYCNSIPKPKWHDIRIGFDETQPPCGQVLCSFIIARDDMDFLTPAKYVDLDKSIMKKDYALEINVLGLRNLESFGLMPIKKPYIKFRVKSLLPPSKAQAVTNVQTDPNSSGANPNINTMLNFFVNLPVEKLYCPALECDAFDFVYRGLSQPLIGTFSIPIGQIKDKTEENWKEELTEQEQILIFLEDHLKKSKDEIEGEVRNARETFGKKMNQRLKNKLIDKAAQELAAGFGAELFAIGTPKKGAADDRLIVTDRDDGYTQMVDPEAQHRHMDTEGEIVEETKGLINDSKADYQSTQNTIFHGRDESDPLMSSKKQMEKAQLALEEFLELRADHSKKSTPADDKKKAQLQRSLIAAQKTFNEEKKKAEKVQKELELHEMKAQGGESHQTIILPKYKLQEELKFYEEIDEPPRRLYKAVGFNDKDQIRTMMEGDDNEKRTIKEELNEYNNLKEQFENQPELLRASTLKKSKTQLKRNKSKKGQMEVEETPEEKYERMRHDNEKRMMRMTNKHYRKFYEDELENDENLFSEKNKPFINIDIKRGQSRGLKKSWFSFFTADKTDESGEVTNEKTVGQFKGRIRVFNRKDEADFKTKKEQNMIKIFKLLDDISQKFHGSPIGLKHDQISSLEELEAFKLHIEKMGVKQDNLIEYLKDAAYEEIIRKQLLTQTNCKILLYMMEGYDLASRDIGSFSDPYLIITCGNKVFNERDNYQLDEANPEFYKRYEFTAEFPGAPQIIIDAMDYDDLFGDDLIGRTCIDLDDRFFNGDWQAMEEKPIEYRQIYHESTSLSQGVVICWLDIEQSTKASKEEKVWDITPEPIRDYEVRVSVLETKNVPCVDTLENMSDVFVKAYISDDDKRETDTHFRCADGAASFNYRLKFDVTAPRKDELKLVLQAWDFDLFSKNDYICEWVLDLERMFYNVRHAQTPVTLNKEYFNSLIRPYMKDKEEIQRFEFIDGEDAFWVKTYVEGKDGDKTEVKIKLDIRILPVEHAKQKENGTGRQEPNMYPYLPPPVGRIQFSLNPFTMIKQLIGNELFSKIQGMLCVLLCCFLCIMMAPILLSNFFSALMLKMFGLS